MGRFGEEIIDRLDRTPVWPLRGEQKVRKRVEERIAFRESDRVKLKELAEWRHRDRRYRVDPLGPKISESFADLIFGRHPRVKPAAAGEQGQGGDDNEAMAAVLEENNLGRRLRRGAVLSSSEGEVWWRLHVDLDVSERPILEWLSRLDVVPHYVSERLKAAAFISTYDDGGPVDDLTGLSEAERVFRHFEVHEPGEVHNVLYVGNARTLGQRVDLGALPETADLAEDWQHDLPGMLAGRITNGEGAQPELGPSDYDPIMDFLLDLNEVMSIGAENARLTLKKRVVVDPASVDAEGNLPAGQEVIVSAGEDPDAAGKTGSGQSSLFKVLEYNDNAQPLIDWSNDLAQKALNRLGIDAQFAGLEAAAGRAESGVALRIRLIPSVNAGEARAQDWDDQLPKILRLAAILDARNADENGAGHGGEWSDPEGLPAVDRGSALPEDPVEHADRLRGSVAGPIMSTETAVRDLHPDWDEAEIKAEIARIRVDVSQSSAFGGFNDRPVDEPPEDKEPPEEDQDEADEDNPESR
jgi:hypothetical protein